MEGIVFDFEKHRASALSQFREVRGLYEDLAETVSRILADALKASSIAIHSIQVRAKTFDSFADKASKASPENPREPKYTDPLSQITDLAAARVITFLPGLIESVCKCIESEFVVLEKTDKSEELLDEGRFGYHSIHFLVQLSAARTGLSEYSRFANRTFEIQVRTILQHAWAEMEHDIQYKSSSVIPSAIRRRFIALAGMLEIADREFQALQLEDQKVREEARTAVESGDFSEVEITPDSLKAYLDRKLGPDGRQNSFSYDLSASHVKKLGFTSLQQLDDCLNGYDDDFVSRAMWWGSRQGQISRFEDTLLASMGQVYIERHPWGKSDYWSERFPEKLEQLREHGVEVGCYDPLRTTDNSI